jgi:hypothetical protein
MVTIDDLKPLPPPAADDTHGNVRTKRVRVSDDRKKRPRKGLVQHNVKVRARASDRFNELAESMKATDPEFTKGDLFELMLAAYEASKDKSGLASITKVGRLAPVPEPRDRAEGRTVHFDLFATPELAQGLKSRSNEKKWSISATIENACADAKDFQAFMKVPCPHCGKRRVGA